MDSQGRQIVLSIISVKCLRQANRSIHYFVSLLLDITERNRQALRQQSLVNAALKINASLSVVKPLNATLRLVTDLAREIIGAHRAVTGHGAAEDGSQSIVAVSLSDQYRDRPHHEEKPKPADI